MKINIRAFVIGLLIGGIIIFFLKKEQTRVIEVPVRIEVEVPVIEHVFDTVYEPYEVIKEVEVRDEELIAEYEKANDSLKEALFNSAVTVREYKEVFEDSSITITVDAKVTGTLNSLIAEYKTKPRIVVVDTTLSVEVPDYSRSITVYGELGVPLALGTEGATEGAPILKVGLDLSNKKNWVFGGAIDTEKRVWVKVGKKFNF